MNTNNIKDKNPKALPNYIREDFEIVLENFECGAFSTDNEENDGYFIHKELFVKLERLYKKNELFVNLHPNVIFGDPLYLKSNFELVGQCANNNGDYYRYSHDASFLSFVCFHYKTGFNFGYYDEDFDNIDSKHYFKKSKNEFLINKIFNLAYSSPYLAFKLKEIMDESYNKHVIISYRLEKYAKKVGQFIRAWEIITQYPKKFEQLFKDKGLETYSAKSDIKWLGSQIQLTEYIKAAITAKLIGGTTEKNIVKGFEQLVNYKINDYEESKKSMRRRTLKFTPLLDNLHVALMEWIKKNDWKKSNS